MNTNIILKQFGVLVTNLKRNPFNKAVFRLTVYYTFGVLGILLVFNVLVYALFSRSILQHDLLETESRIEETYDQHIMDSLFKVLLFSDVLFIIIAISISYVLSKKTLAPLEEAHKNQKKFISDAAHELRTPLAVIKAGGEVVLKTDRTIPEYKKFTAETLEEVERLIALSNDLLRLDNNTRNVRERTRISLSSLCDRQCDSVLAYARARGITLTKNIATGIKIQGVQSDIARLLLNLLKNSIDYNRAQGSITATLTAVHGQAILVIADTGIGIGKNDLPHVFKRFYKADSARTHKDATGTGLGLAIAQEIAEDHQGSITVDSELGKGTTVTVKIPTI